MPTDTEMLDFLINHVHTLLQTGPTKYTGTMSRHNVEWLSVVGRKGIAQAMDYRERLLAEGNDE